MAGGDGNGWVECRCGHRHWGRHGAAGLLLVRPEPALHPDGAAAHATGDDTATAGDGATGRRPGHVAALLQLRAGWTHLGGTWGLPGGAADSHESAAQAALREAHEEVGVPPDQLLVLGEVVGTDHGDWRYTVVFAEPVVPVRASVANDESDEVRWVALDDVAALPLHPGFAESWPAVSAALDAVLAGPRDA